MDLCLHCDEKIFTPVYETQGEESVGPFCCEGCLTVFQILNLKGLGEYYSIKGKAPVIKRRSPVEVKESSFGYLDDSDFLKEYSYLDLRERRVLEFYLEGIHCLACLWLIEKLPEFLPEVVSCKLEIDKSVVTVTLAKGGCFSEVARELNQLGYRPHALKRDQDSRLLRLKEERSQLIRIGISGAAAGNIMLYAVSLYGGADGTPGAFFNLLTVLFAVPVLTYCALPFYQNAWFTIKNRSLSIDIPISLSLIVGGMMGVIQLFQGVQENYFDSLSTLVFLLLISRYFLQKIQEKGLAPTDLNFFYQSDAVKKMMNGKIVEVHPRSLQIGDTIIVDPQEMIPVDGEVLDGESQINNSLLTGESLPVKVERGSEVFSGTENLNSQLKILVSKKTEDSRLGRILKNIENGWTYQSRMVSLTNLVSKYFTLSVILLSAFLFIYVLQSHGLERALESAITLLIVTCPCALALAVPLTFTRSLGLAGRHGIIVKNDEVLEKLSHAQNLFLDKTGTITYGQVKVTSMKIHGDMPSIYDIIFSLESRSRHPVGKALKEYARDRGGRALPLIDFVEVPGEGVCGFYEDSCYEIKNNQIIRDQKVIGEFEVEDIIRDEIREVVRDLNHLGLSPMILSGDQEHIVKKLSLDAGISPALSRGKLKPEEKCQVIEASRNSVMVGDGANDAMALRAADVGIAVFGAMDISLRAAEVYLTTPGLKPLRDLFILSQETMKVVKRNLILSLLYNSISVVLAFMGLISPLTAAIIMPLSSLTVLLSTYSGTLKMRSLWKS